ncbi:hypothetical protein BDV93DRAFT_515824 [Ceratobasidium sp. AG-I]|nr:hypothetical protein BDV93DRAFT_515824 [Ceratobasidium sp. AG-I]
MQMARHRGPILVYSNNRKNGVFPMVKSASGIRAYGDCVYIHVIHLVRDDFREPRFCDAPPWVFGLQSLASSEQLGFCTRPISIECRSASKLSCYGVLRKRVLCVRSNGPTPTELCCIIYMRQMPQELRQEFQDNRVQTPGVVDHPMKMLYWVVYNSWCLYLYILYILY